MALCLLNPCNPCVAISMACIGDNSLSMSTVGATPGICIKSGQGAADSATCYLNTIGKWGTTVAAIFTCRPVKTSNSGVAVGPKGTCLGSLFGGGASNFSNIIVLLVIIAIIYFVLEKS
jgi:hypothetical protein